MSDEQNNITDKSQPQSPDQPVAPPAAPQGGVNQPVAPDAAAPLADEQQQPQGKRDIWDLPPSDAPANARAIFATSLFILTLITLLLICITASWPVCDLEPVAAASPTPTSTPTPAATPAATPGATAANTNANVVANANTNVNANANANANAGGSRNANANTNLNANPAQPNAAATPPPKLDIDGIEPDSGTIFGNTQVNIKGKGFEDGKELLVRFGEDQAKIGKVTADTLTVRTPMHSEGIVDVTVEKGTGDDMQRDVLDAAYTYVCPTPKGTGLFAMLIMAGALGGCIHAARSLWWYTGQGTLKARWLPMYFALPFIGAAMAMIFSLLIFAGFVSNATGRGESLFIIAVAGLVGMFSQQAALKLTDIANAFFTKPGSGKDSDPQESLSVGAGGQTGAVLTAAAMDKNTGTAAGNQPVTITGTGFTDETTVTFGGKPAAVVKPVTATAIIVRTPSGTAGTEVEVEVKTGSQTAKLPIKFKYT